MAESEQDHTGGVALRHVRLRATIVRFLPDLILGANDGIITTLAVISGVVGAGLSPVIIVILGFANLLADGFSMAASNVLSRRSEALQRDMPSLSVAGTHGFATFLGFAIAGLVPLLAYLLPGMDGRRFVLAVGLALVALFVVGASRALVTDRGWAVAGFEMLLIGSLAAGVAYGVGALGALVIGGASLAGV